MSNDWIEHDGGPQPVGDDVWVHVQWADLEGGYPSRVPDEMEQASELPWEGNKLRYRILNQHLIAAKQVEIDTVAEAAILHRGIRLGVLAAARSIVHEDDLRAILSIDTLAILKETRDDQ